MSIGGVVSKKCVYLQNKFIGMMEIKRICFRLNVLLLCVFGAIHACLAQRFFYKGGNYEFSKDNPTELSLVSVDNGQEVVIPKSLQGEKGVYNVTAIGRQAFFYCDSLVKVSLPSSVVEIGDLAFATCVNVKEIILPQKTKHIGYLSFAYCSRIKDFIIPNAVEDIGSDAFYKCDSLVSVTIGASMKIMGRHIFEGCGELSEIKVSSIVPPSIFDDTFTDENFKCTLYVPIGTKEQYLLSGNWAKFRNIVEYVAPIVDLNDFVENDESDDIILPLLQKVSDEGKVYTYVDQMPEFPGGEAAMQRYIYDHLKYPSVSIENDVQGTVMVRFVINENGSVGDVQILKGLDTYCDREAKRIVQSLPRFTPGRQHGSPVKVWLHLPIRFEKNKI